VMVKVSAMLDVPAPSLTIKVKTHSKQKTVSLLIGFN